MSDVKIPKRIQKIIDRMKCGEVLRYDFNPKSTSADNDRFWFEPSSRNVAPRSVRQAVELGLIVPCGDALFADIPSQTYRLAP